jgi:hypothetical protein
MSWGALTASDSGAEGSPTTAQEFAAAGGMTPRG